MNPLQPALAGGSDVFVAKLNATGSGLVYSTYLGGSGNDGGSDIAVDVFGNAYVAGNTASVNFPTMNAIQATYGGGSFDAFVAKLDAAGSSLVYSTYLGGSGQDSGTGIAVDSSRNTYVTGFTNSSNFPTANPLQASFGGGSSFGDAFVAKVNPAGSALVYSTYLGGSGFDEGDGIVVDSAGNALLTGLTSSNDFPTVSPIQATFAGGTFDAFVAKLNTAGSALVFSTYLGGSGSEEGSAIALDSLPNPNIYVVGVTSSTDFPTTAGAFQTAYGGGGNDAFVVKIANIVLPPGATSGKVTGGGTVNVSGGIANFGFIVQAILATGQISGDLQYVNHASGAKIHSVMFTTFTITGNTATFSGTCTNNGAPCTFNVKVQDNDQPPGPDSFVISINGGTPEGGTLRDGDIEIH